VEVIGVLAGVGEAVSEWSPGQTVITMMQGLGGVRAERPGGYAEFVTVDADAIAKVHAEVAPAHMAALGLAGVTAFEGLRRLGAVAGRRVLVTGAAGGVGSAACALAAERGAEVVGLVSRPEQADYVRGLGATSVVIAREDEPPQIPPESVNAVFDTVGGKVFPIAVAALRAGGVLSLVGAVGGGDVAFDAWNLIRPVTLTGYSSETLTGPALREAVDALAAALRSGAIRPPQHEIVPLPQAADAHRRLEAGGVQGRILLQPATHGD
jgi:NADPH2:quinone reductase